MNQPIRSVNAEVALYVNRGGLFKAVTRNCWSAMVWTSWVLHSYSSSTLLIRRDTPTRSLLKWEGDQQAPTTRNPGSCADGTTAVAGLGRLASKLC